MFSKIARAFVGKSTVDDEVLDNLEEVLISSDVGVDTTLKIIDRIEKRVTKEKIVGAEELNNFLRSSPLKIIVGPNFFFISYSISSAIDDFPDPDNPVIQNKIPLFLFFLNLCI